MTRELFAVLCAIFVVLVLGLAWLAWRRRAARHADVEPPRRLEGEFTALIDAPMILAAITRRGDPYDRVTRHGMAHRARGRIAVGTSGILLDAATPILIPASHVLGVERATWTIDRAVEPGGLVRISFRQGAELDADVRVLGDDQPIIDAIAALVQTEGAPHDS